MAKKNKNEQENKGTVTLTTGKAIALVVAPTIMAGLLGGYIIGNKTGQKQNNNSDTGNTYQSSQDKPSTTDLGIKYQLTEAQEKAEKDYFSKEIAYFNQYTKLDEENTQRAASELAIEFSLIRERECSTLVQTSSTSYDCYLYNNKNECIMQSADGSLLAVFDKEGHSITYNGNQGSFGIDASVDIVACCESITNMVKNNREGVSIYTVDTSSHQNELESGEITNPDGSKTPVEYTGGKITEYIVDIRGTDACTGIYSSMGEDKSKEFIKKLKDQLQDPNADYWVPHIIYDVAYNESHEIEIYCSVVYGEPQENWILSSAAPSQHWELSNDWYTLDLNKLAESDPVTLKDKFEVEIKQIESSLGIDDLVNDLKEEIDKQTEEIKQHTTSEGTTSEGTVQNEETTSEGTTASAE